jgi:perosamine synthetase
MIVTDDDYLADRCRSLSNFCFQNKKRLVHEELGYNLRMTNLQAAVGLAQLERLPEFVERKRCMGKRYTELLAGCEGVQFMPARTEFADDIYWVYGVVRRCGFMFDSSKAWMTDMALSCDHWAGIVAASRDRLVQP